MEFESTEKHQMVYETLKYRDSHHRLQERTVQIHTVDDFLLSPFGMEKLDAVCMVLIAMGEAVKTLDKLTNKELLPKYPEVEWKKVMGTRDTMTHHYFEVDADEVFNIVNNPDSDKQPRDSPLNLGDVYDQSPAFSNQSGSAEPSFS